MILSRAEFDDPSFSKLAGGNRSQEGGWDAHGHSTPTATAVWW